MKQIGWMLACVVLPVLWGAFVHWAFLHLRLRQDQSRERGSDNWPDYQI